MKKITIFTAISFIFVGLFMIKDVKPQVNTTTTNIDSIEYNISLDSNLIDHSNLTQVQIPFDDDTN